jgi:G3E family GTPase
MAEQTTRLPVTVIGGYLGAGKTTLVNHLLRHAAGRRLAVLVNDFGDLSIDADLIEGGDDEVMQLAGGCVCCTIGSDLMATLGELRTRFAHIEHVLLEASGVALPGTVAASVALIPGVRRSSVVVVVAADRLRALLADRYLADTVQRQIVAADLLVVTHAEALGEAMAESVSARLHGINPTAPVVFAEHGRIPVELVLEPALTGAPAPATGGLAPRPLRLPSARFTSLTLAPAQTVDAQAVCAALADPALGIERAKGLLATVDGASLIHGTGSRWSCEPWPGALPAQGPRLVVIGVSERLDPEAVLARLPGFRQVGSHTL